MLKLIKNKIIQAVVKSDAFKNAVEDLTIKGVDIHLNECDIIDRDQLDNELRDVAYNYDLITTDNIDQYIDDCVTINNVNDYIDDRLEYHDLKDFDVGFVVEQYCEENLSNKFLDHANALTKHFKVVVKDTSNDGHLESEGNNG